MKNFNNLIINEGYLNNIDFFGEMVVYFFK